MFLKGNADWLSELPSVIKKYNNTIHKSTEMTPIERSEKVNEKTVFSNIQDKREKRKPKFNLWDLVRTADIVTVFRKGDFTNWNVNFTLTQLIHDAIPSFIIKYLPERYNDNLIRPSKLTLDENLRVMKELNLIQ